MRLNGWPARREPHDGVNTADRVPPSCPAGKWTLEHIETLSAELDQAREALASSEAEVSAKEELLRESQQAAASAREAAMDGLRRSDHSMVKSRLQESQVRRSRTRPIRHATGSCRVYRRPPS